MKTRTFYLGEQKVLIECEGIEGQYFDSKVTIDGKQLCWISWPEKEEFEKELTDTINKYRI